jgi:dihydrofolate reductase
VRLSLIAAVARNGTIGRDGGLPWQLAADLGRFKLLTTGHAVLMGRRTWESIGRRPLARRFNIVLSRRPELELPEGVAHARSLDEGLGMAVQAGYDELFVLGGASLYAEALPRADRLHLTEIDAEVQGDVSFPDWERESFEVAEEETVPADERNEYASTYRLYVRRR